MDSKPDAIAVEHFPRKAEEVKAPCWHCKGAITTLEDAAFHVASVSREPVWLTPFHIKCLVEWFGEHEGK